MLTEVNHVKKFRDCWSEVVRLYSLTQKRAVWGLRSLAASGYRVEEVKSGEDAGIAIDDVIWAVDKSIRSVHR